MNKPDTMPLVLSPVGGAQQLRAALRTGADAVYLGAKGFNARRNAENFDDMGLEDAINACHERGVFVYVTLNTLVMDAEFPALIAELDDIAKAKADAIIVQDLGVAAVIRRRYPTLPIYASTQTTVHNGEGAKLLCGLGFEQVVLARELSAAEIKAVQAASPIKIECFVHGAHCMCMSGACYLSAMLGGRSGNRGLCAQPCRMNFRLNNKEYALSLKDMSLIPHMNELKESGIHALKIEGRMKRPEYVAAATLAAKAALRGEKPDMHTLKAVFSRSGFTDGYYTGQRTADMFGTRTKEDVACAKDVLPKLAAAYENEPMNIPIFLKLCVKADEPVSLSISDGEHSLITEGPVPQSARTLPLNEENALRALSQTGGTPYYVEKAEFEIENGLSLPVSALKALRRQAIGLLKTARCNRKAYVCTNEQPSPNELPGHIPNEVPEMRLEFSSFEQMFTMPDDCAVILPIEEIAAHTCVIETLGGRLFAKLPALCFPEDMQKLKNLLCSLKGLGLKHVVADNLGLVQTGLESGLKVHGDYGLNILNSLTLNEFERLGLEDATLSIELKMAAIRKLKGNIKRGIIGYGYLPLMRMRACPAKGEKGCGDCTGENTLVDEKREKFRLACHGRKYTELFNSVPVYIGDKPHGGVDFITLKFTKEAPAQAEAVYKMFIRGETPDFRRTGGLYYRDLL